MFLQWLPRMGVMKMMDIQANNKAVEVRAIANKQRVDDRLERHKDEIIKKFKAGVPKPRLIAEYKTGNAQLRRNIDRWLGGGAYEARTAYVNSNALKARAAQQRLLESRNEIMRMFKDGVRQCDISAKVGIHGATIRDALIEWTGNPECWKSRDIGEVRHIAALGAQEYEVKTMDWWPTISQGRDVMVGNLCGR